MRRASLLLLLGALTLSGQNPPASSIAPAHNWALDLYTAGGYRSMTLRGDEVHTLDADRIQVADLNITVFSGDAKTLVTSVVLSPSATFYQREEKAEGTEGVRIIRDNLEISGQRDWTFERAGEKISIRGGAHVVLKAQINDMLK